MNETIGRYEIHEEIGKGYQSTVYKGYDRIAERQVAIKKRNYLKGAQKEVLVMKKYGNHPYLPVLYDNFTHKNRSYIVMEFISGKVLGSGGKVDKRTEREAIQITMNVLKGLEHLHERGILHCDILPKNIIVNENNLDDIKIIDYGFSFEKDENGRFQGEKKHRRVGGKPPELRVPILTLDDTTDVYEAAHFCTSLIKGRLPYWNEQKKTHIVNLKNKSLQEVLEKAMSFDKHKRFSSAKEFQEALKPLLKKSMP